MSAVETIDWSERQVRRVSRGVALGVLLAPLVFAWVLLRPGYSPRVRMLGFSWMALRVTGDLSLLAQLGLTLNLAFGRLG